MLIPNLHLRARQREKHGPIELQISKFDAQTQLYRRVGRQDHYGQRRNRPHPPLAGKTRRGRPEDLSGNLIVQLGKATEDLNRTWYERNTGRPVGDVQRQ